MSDSSAGGGASASHGREVVEELEEAARWGGHLKGEAIEWVIMFGRVRVGVDARKENHLPDLMAQLCVF